MAPGGTDILNRLVLFEQSLSEREKEITDRENVLHQREDDFAKEMERAKLEIRKTITKQIKIENEAYLNTESQRLQDEHDRFVDGIRSLKKNLEDQYNNKIRHIESRETDMSKSIEEKDKKIAFSKELIQETRKTLTSAEKSIAMLENQNQRLEDIITAKEEKIITLYDSFTSIVPTQANDSTIEPKKYITTNDRDRWYNLRKDIEIDPEIRKKYTFRRKNEIQERNLNVKENSPCIMPDKVRDRKIENIYKLAMQKGYTG
ncbi:unnamed protein product [Rhizophagus irregularis]|uniref:Uncharacterized protein n=1 Tax=Rhizophagus irregularis TaxID=588596 RepID=A0A2N1MNC4_9GLOM|nr:hypothetical protein RhiirC2_717222 [Rhizophagus irregularis]CAB4399544.1 unnamed protein product [Rhizophagus irregularis]